MIAYTYMHVQKASYIISHCISVPSGILSGKGGEGGGRKGLCHLLTKTSALVGHSS